MAITDSNVGQTGILGRSYGLFGVTDGGTGQVGDVKIGSKAKQGVRDIEVDGGDEAGQLANFSRRYVARYKQRAGHDQRQLRTFTKASRSMGKII